MNSRVVNGLESVILDITKNCLYLV